MHGKVYNFMDVCKLHILARQLYSSEHGSWNFNENIEWKLSEEIFIKVVDIWGKPEIDMFASRLNTQLPKYVSWKPKLRHCL